MKCREFRETVTDGLRSGGSQAHGELFRHAAACPECSRRLREENALNLALQRLRGAHATEEASPGVEECVLAELRSVRDDSRMPAGVIAGRGRMSFSVHFRLAAAAGLVLACGLLIWFAFSGWDSSAPIRQSSSEYPASPVARPPEPARQSDQEAKAQATVDLAHARVVPAAKGNLARAGARVRTGRTGAEAAPRATAARGDRPAAAAVAADTGEATPFIPTMLPLGMESDYGLQLVRVEVPRSTMVSFGLRVNRRDLDRPVKADLIIGPDGLTRAIRFVQ